jgi:hypothetical protein
MVMGPFFMWKKSINQYFDEQLRSGSDYDFCIRLALTGKIGMTDENLGYYLDEGKGASTNGDGRQPLERTVIELRYGILDKIETSYLSKALTNYDIRHIINDNKKTYIGDIVPDYESFLIENRNPT